MARRIGIYGGSFDPVHVGHLILAEIVRETVRLDEVRMTPAAIAPHKRTADRAPDRARWDMLELAIGGHPHIRPWSLELDRGGISYTVDTLRTAQEEDPEAEFFLLMGADALADLPQWRSPEEICQRAVLVVVDRPGSQAVDFDVLEGIVDAQRRELFREHTVRMPQLDISSSDLRARVAAGRSIRYQTPRAVEEYIRQAALYAQSR